jgi:outer membrane protein assembly factor BamB
MKKRSASFVSFVILFTCMFCSGFTGNIKTVLGDNSNASINNDFSSWPMFHNDLAHSGYTQSTGPVTNQTLWSYQTGSILSSPTVAGGIVYIGLKDGKILALNASNGAILWNYQTGGGVHSSPAVADNVVYFGSWDNYVYALNASTGAVLWTHKTGSYVQSSPTVANGLVFVASYDANVSALDAATGNLLWSFRTGAGAVGSSPAVVNGIVFVGDNGGKVWALNASKGTVIWKFTAGDTVYSSPAVVNGVVYIGGDLVADGTVYGLDATTGTKLWSFSTGNLWVYSSPAVANGVVYVGSYDHLTSSNSGILYALDASTGKMLWSYPVGTEVMTSPIVANDVVYAGGYENKFYALNAFTGAVLWSYQLDSPSTDSWSSAAVADGILYVCFEEGTLFAFGSANASPTQTPTSSPTSSPTPNLNTQPNATESATTDYGKTVNLTLSGNITNSQMSKVTIAVNNATTTGLFFTVTGKNGTIGFSNITIPKSLVPPEATPLIFIDAAQAQSQGYTQDTNNYYVYYTTHFSTHQIAIMFTSTTSSSTPITTNGKTSWLQVVYGLGAAMVVVLIIACSTYFVLNVKRKRTKKRWLIFGL